ncbi:MAG: hypothetical protein WCO36_10270 [Actinomycetes bacterium]
MPMSIPILISGDDSAVERLRRYRSRMGFNPARGHKPKSSDLAILGAAFIVIAALLLWSFGIA